MQFRDLGAQYSKYKEEINAAIKGVLDSTDFISGKEVSELEEELSEYIGIKYAITCANGTEAMTLAMMAWGIEEGDAVFIPDFTFFSTGEVVAFAGATPIFVDVDRDTFNIDVNKLEIAINKVISEGIFKPRAIIPVDLFGLPANYPKIREIADKYNLLVLEDGAQGFGGSINGKRACSFGDISTTSFFPAKPLGCYGDGGAIFTNSSEWAALLRSLKVHGKGENKYDNVRIGVNSRLDTIQAAILRVKLKALKNHELDDVNRIAVRYNEKLKDIVDVPVIPDGYYSSFAQYTIKFSNSDQRNNMRMKFRENNIPSMVYYEKPMHKQLAFQVFNANDNDFAVTNTLCDTVLSLPMHPYLTDEDIDYIVNIIRDNCTHTGC